VDLIPNVGLNNYNINTFYSCLAVDKKSIFQAFMRIKDKHNPLILYFLISFLINRPYTYKNGPTYDMYNCLRYSLKVYNIKAGKNYYLNNIRIPINVGNSYKNTKIVKLYYFPKIKHYIKILNVSYKNLFNCYIEDNNLHITRTGKNYNQAHRKRKLFSHARNPYYRRNLGLFTKNTGWDLDLKLEIVIENKSSMYFFQECSGGSIERMYVKNNNKILFNSRDPIYYYNKGWDK